MTIIVRDVGSTPRTIVGIAVRDADNNLQDVNQIYARDSNGVPRLVFSLGAGLSVVCSPDVVGGVAYGTGIVTTNTSTATPSGGTAPYTYAWTVLSHTNATPPTANSPTAATSDFTQIDVLTDDSATFRCTVTDDNSATAFADITAFFTNVTPP